MPGELARREKIAGIKPDEDLDIFMKSLALGGKDTSLVVEYIMKGWTSVLTHWWGIKCSRIFLGDKRSSLQQVNCWLVQQECYTWMKYQQGLIVLLPIRSSNISSIQLVHLKPPLLKQLNSVYMDKLQNRHLLDTRQSSLGWASRQENFEVFATTRIVRNNKLFATNFGYR
ncbi:uncharacterized protein LOC122314228 isoform X2 [Carya illinoinensis]|uniref:uncharacterized protein LOC122314228 isoform X2 n=1 Tax=Carya illinoinensis TaxID=32201 RepID=UPI001C71B500|nr:uncharacterized protein LOC122314228 isoform X2 [Carya illinoinensis]